MYVKEAGWYRKQQRQVKIVKRIRRLCMIFVMLLSVCFCVFTNVLADRLPKLPLRAGAQPLVENNTYIGEEYVSGEAEDTLFRQPIKHSMASFLTEQSVLGVNRSYLIAIDAGHGGADEGCSVTQIEEKDINLYLALVLQEKLEEMGFEVLLTRTEDVELSLEERVKLANEAGADAYISIHQNACEDKSVHGIETWYCSGEDKDSKRLAQLVEKYAVHYTGAKERELMETDTLYVIRESAMPACLIETGFLTNAKECTRLLDEEYCEKIVQGIADGIQLYFYPKVMYLTFDDGPSAENTQKILDILKEKNIKATFFVVGENVERNPEIAKRIVEEGHTIGIHCYHHAYDKIYESVESYVEDFEKARQVVYEITGEDVKLFRIPGGSINSYNKAVYTDIIKEMTDKGYVYFDWNASLEDAVKNPKAEKLIQNAKESTLGRKKVVMLAHDIIGATAECLDDLIDEFPEYEMRALADDVEPVQFK